MVNISKRKVKKEVFNAINKQFISFISNLSESKDTERFIKELMTDSEQVQFTKRFAILVMLEKGYRFSDIQEILKVSSSTVSRIQIEKENGFCESTLKHVHIILGYRKIEQNKKEYTALRAYFETLFLPLPPMGKGRWRNLDRMDEIQRKRQLYKKNRQKQKGKK